jgi:hypothetical protein
MTKLHRIPPPADGWGGGSLILVSKLIKESETPFHCKTLFLTLYALFMLWSGPPAMAILVSPFLGHPGFTSDPSSRAS